MDRERDRVRHGAFQDLKRKPTKPMKKHIAFTIVAAFCIMLFSGCASGPTYKNSVGSLTPKPGKGLVLAYWTAGFVGAAAEFHVYANGQEVGHGLGRGAFLSYDANPGPLVLSTRGKLNVATALGTAITAVPTAGITLAGTAAAVSITNKNPDVMVAAGQTHFVRLGSGAFSMKFKEVPREKGEEEIANCHWVNAPKG